jgi:hypothetical protein
MAMRLRRERQSAQALKMVAAIGYATALGSYKATLPTLPAIDPDSLRFASCEPLRECPTRVPDTARALPCCAVQDAVWRARSSAGLSLDVVRAATLRISRGWHSPAHASPVRVWH